jgi:hypothetical protein
MMKGAAAAKHQCCRMLTLYYRVATAFNQGIRSNVTLCEMMTYLSAGQCSIAVLAAQKSHTAYNTKKNAG